MPTQSPVASLGATRPSTQPVAVAAPSVSNRLLAALPPDARQRIMALATRLPLEKAAVLVKAGSPQTDVYFPCSGLLSLQTMTQDGDSVEVAMVGREGVAPLPFIAGTTAVYTTIVTIPGHALRVGGDALLDECERTPQLHRLLIQHWNGVTTEIAKGSACHRFHTARQRLACWLLRASDRIHASEIEVTHEQLARILGLQRTCVTAAHVGLLDYGALTSRHGLIRILDRGRLRHASCACDTRLS